MRHYTECFTGKVVSSRLPQFPHLRDHRLPGHRSRIYQIAALIGPLETERGQYWVSIETLEVRCGLPLAFGLIPRFFLSCEHHHVLMRPGSALIWATNQQPRLSS
jgi:hypothetical protein